MTGSHAYAEAHEAELDGAVFVLNTDNGAGAPRGWSVDGRDDEPAALRPGTGLAGSRFAPRRDHPALTFRCLSTAC